MIQPAPPAASRAVIVALETYNIHTLRGPVAEALLVAQTLLDIGVPPRRIDLWLAPAAGQPEALAAPLKIKGRRFEEAAFFNFLVHDLTADAAGGTLYVHWCGHGLAKTTANGPQHHLLLPQADAKQLYSLPLAQLQALLKDATHTAFSHLVYVVDTCSEDAQAWGQIPLAPQGPQPNGIANGPVHCCLFACAEGQTTTYSAQGSRLGEVLRPMLQKAGPGQWPDFKAELQAAGSQLQLPGARAAQYVHATDWFGQPLLWAREPALDSVFASADVAFGRQAELAWLCPQPGMAYPCVDSPAALVAFLDDLPATEGVAPLHEFALRLLAQPDVGPAVQLREWVKDVVTPTERATIAKRMAEPAPQRVVQLWVENDPDRPSEPAWCIRAALCDAKGVPVVLQEAQDIHATCKAAGASALRRVLHRRLLALVEQVPVTQAVTVDLFVPASVVALRLEHETLDFDEKPLNLARDLPTLLRHGRQGLTQQRNWRNHAPTLLQRWQLAKPLAAPVQSAQKDAAGAFFQPNGPLWCLVVGAEADDAHLLASYKICLNEGLPALAWITDATGLDAKALQAQLDAGLRSPADAVWQRLVQLRRAGLPGLSLMLDDPDRPPTWSAKPGQT